MLRFRNRRTGSGGRNRHACRRAWTGGAEPGKLIAQQVPRIQYLDRAVAFGTFDDAIQKVRIDGARTGIVLLDPVGRKRQEVVDPIDDKSDRIAALNHDHPGGLVDRCVGETEQASQADNRQHHPMKVGKTQEASRRQRHMGEAWQPNDLADIVQSKPEPAIGDPERHEMRVVRTWNNIGPSSRLRHMLRQSAAGLLAGFA